MCRHFADDARIAPVPGQSRIGRVAVGEQRGSTHFDDTGARHKGRNAICTQIGDDRFTCFGTTYSKSRLNFLECLRAGYAECRQR